MEGDSQVQKFDRSDFLKPNTFYMVKFDAKPIAQPDQHNSKPHSKPCTLSDEPTA